MPWIPVDPVAASWRRRRRQASDAIRPKHRTRPYRQREWTEARHRQLAREPLCELCRASAATEVHHANCDPWDNGPDNLVSACKPCHTAITVHDLRRRKRNGAEGGCSTVPSSPS